MFDRFVAGDIDGTKVSNEKKLYVGMMKGFYYVNHNSTMENTEERMVYSLRKARDYVSEGANFILMRFLACTIYIGTFELSCMYINGDMCRNIYVRSDTNVSFTKKREFPQILK